MSSGIRALLLAGTGVALPAPAAAQSAVEVDEVVVTRSLEETLPQELARYGARLEVVTAEQMQNRGFTDVGQVLQTSLPGLSLIPQSGPFGYNIASLQGSRPGEILYLIDGVRISNRLYNTTPPLDTVPAHMVERVELLEGGQSLFYGTQAIAGVVNIVTRAPTGAPSGRLEAAYDTNEALSLNGYGSAGAGGHRLLVFASHDEASGYRVFSNGQIQPSLADRHRGYRMTSGGLKYDADLGERLRFSASWTHTEGHAELARPNLVTENFNHRNEEVAWAKLDVEASDAVSLFVKGYWHDWDSHFNQTNTGAAGPVVVSDREKWQFEDYGVNLLGRAVLRPGLELWGGYDVQRYGGFDDVLIILPRKETTHAVFAQVRLGPDVIPGAHLAAGFRHNMAKTSDDATVWNVSGQYDVSDALFVRGAAGTAFRLPDAESLFAQDPLENGEVGNPDLKPERAEFLNASVGGQAGGWRGELIGFWRETKDLISLAGATPDPDVLTFINLPDKVKARGFQVVVNGEPSPWVSLQASYTHARTRQSGQDAQLAGVPEDYGMAAIDVHEPGGAYGGGVLVSYTGNIFDNVASGIGRVGRGDHLVADLNAWARVGGNGRLSLRLENVFDETYTTLVRRFFTDGGAPFAGRFRGVPRTLHVSYAHSF
jgi:vitamin B12 transporter